MTEAKKVKEQICCDQKMQDCCFRYVSVFNASPSERRWSSRILYNCLIIRSSLLYTSLPAPLSKQSTPVPVMGRLLLKYHQRVGYPSRGRVEISYITWGRKAKKFEKPCTTLDYFGRK